MREIYHIDPPEFWVDQIHVTEDGNLQYDLSIRNLSYSCPVCGSSDIIRHGIRKRAVRDLPEHMKNVGLLISMQKYRCNECNTVFTDKLLSIDSNARMTIRMRDYIRSQSLRRPFLSIADELSITDTTVRRIFKSYVSELDKSRKLKAPSVLGIDENHLLRKYRAVFTDVENRLLIEILPNRSKDSVIKFIRSLPDYQSIRVVTCDMWAPYRDAAHEVIPNADVVVDKFHVIKMLNDALEKIRKRLRSGQTPESRRGLRRSRYLMLSNSEELDESCQQQLYAIFEAYPVFQKPHMLKEEFREIYLLSENQCEAEQRYSEWCLHAAGYPEFETVRNTVDNWHKEIFAYFEHHYTNAVTESLNRLINEISDRGRGYSFDVLRAKVLYGTKATKPAKYRFTYSSPVNNPLMMQFAASYANTPQCIYGDGVDIDELISIIQQEGF